MLAAALVALSMTAAAAEPVEMPAPFHVGEVQRFRIDAKVRLPGVMWVTEERNREARMAQFAVGMVLTCGAEEDGRKAFQVDCMVEGSALQGAPMPSDEGRLGPVLEAMEAQLTGKVVRLRVRRDGRITNVGLLDDGGPANRRTRLRDESLRLIVSRAVAGMDLLRPARFKQDVWLQNQSMLTMAPSVTGTAGATDLAHQLTPRAEGGYDIVSSGKALIAPAAGREEDEDYFAAEVRCVGAVDARGHLVSRSWEVIAQPTASSAIADGTAGLPYVQEGQLRALSEGEVVELGESKEIDPWGPMPTALHTGTTYGAPRPPL